MLKKQFDSHESLNKKTLTGVQKLVDCVSSTLGPRGRNVILQAKDRKPLITKDGVTVAKFVSLGDPFENAAAQVVKEASEKTNSEVINVGNGDQPISLIDLARLVIKLSGKQGKIVSEILNSFDGADRHESREIYARYCNATKVKKLLNWKPQISLEEGLEKVFSTEKIFNGWANVYDEYDEET